jgi:hypothetical protein
MGGTSLRFSQLNATVSRGLKPGPYLQPLRRLQRSVHQTDRAAAFTFKRHACNSGSV